MGIFLLDIDWSKIGLDFHIVYIADNGTGTLLNSRVDN